MASCAILQWMIRFVILFLGLFVIQIRGFDDLSGVRIDTPSVIKEFNGGLIVIKAKDEVTVRLFGTRLHDLKNIRITKSQQSCSSADVVGTITGDSLTEVSPPTATFNYKFPDYSTTYYFCFEWRTSVMRARMEPVTEWNRTSANSGANRVARQATGSFVHQGTYAFLSVSTAQKSWWWGG